MVGISTLELEKRRWVTTKDEANNQKVKIILFRKTSLIIYLIYLCCDEEENELLITIFTSSLRVNGSSQSLHII